jgi:hypothetical protein
MPVILATPETKIRRMEVQGQPRQTIQETPSPKDPRQKKAGGVLKL